MDSRRSRVQDATFDLMGNAPCASDIYGPLFLDVTDVDGGLVGHVMSSDEPGDSSIGGIRMGLHAGLSNDWKNLRSVFQSLEILWRAGKMTAGWKPALGAHETIGL